MEFLCETESFIDDTRAWAKNYSEEKGRVALRSGGATDAMVQSRKKIKKYATYYKKY